MSPVAEMKRQAARALSVRQPWAWLIVQGYKDIENRTWITRFRGRLHIHAAKRMTKADYPACCLFLSGMDTEWRLPSYGDLLPQCGGIVGSVNLVDVVKDSASPWFCGPVGWVFENAEVSAFWPCRGALGLFQHNPT